MPRRATPIWLLTLLLLIGFPALNFVYWQQVLESGVLPVDGDAIAIPIFSSALLALVACPFVLGFAWLSLRHYNPQTKFFAWRSDRKALSVTTTVVAGSATLWVGVVALDGFSFAAPWYEYLPGIYGLALAYWLFALRAAAIEQLGRQ